MAIWDISSSTPMRSLVDWCFDHEAVSHILVSAQLDANRVEYLFPPVEQSLNALFDGYCVESFNATAWPANRLTSHVARIFVSELDRSLADRLCRIGPLLKDWRHNSEPALPEDVCLLRLESNHPALLSCTHHGDAWIVTDNDVNIQGATSSDFSVEELMIPQGRFFCRTALP
jgi:hypothetical protein